MKVEVLYQAAVIGAHRVLAEPRRLVTLGQESVKVAEHTGGEGGLYVRLEGTGGGGRLRIGLAQRLTDSSANETSAESLPASMVLQPGEKLWCASASDSELRIRVAQVVL